MIRINLRRASGELIVSTRRTAAAEISRTGPIESLRTFLLRRWSICSSISQPRELFWRTAAVSGCPRTGVQLVTAGQVVWSLPVKSRWTAFGCLFTCRRSVQPEIIRHPAPQS
ncbi:unnamed protein product [Soboliphyme baturini]|uniref:Uncharacterized protein n=1 Tax=Soboliphyme baturini TaxID=241478 RepID=A0A183IN34_9BILA|nr:unnamed protein product [Soboliphyme baturini]